ncbi:MAG: autotransporter outer membrane beta-barrel domain-containing protein [Desulfobulbus sp.]|nr:autotransporter outer membrane beta-barrel domain-containing protein [Desulfobulbus sp.]
MGGTANNVLGTSGVVTNGASQTGITGGAGGSAAANANDMGASGANVGASDTINIHGGNGGNGGSGYDTTLDSGWVGGNGGTGGSASLNWTVGGVTQTIANLDVLAGQSGGDVLGWTDTSVIPNVPHGSAGGQGGFATFFLDADLVVSGTLNVQARGNYATYEANNLGNAGTRATTTVTATNYLADMKVHGNAYMTTLNVVSNGLGAATFTADGSGIVNTNNNVVVRTNNAGAATFNSVQYFGGGTTDILATGAGNASMTVSTVGSNMVESLNTMTISATNSGNASFTAPLAGTVKITGPAQNLKVTTSGTGGGKASFSAPAATVSVASGNLEVDSSGTITNTDGTATFLSRGLNIAGNTTVTSGAASASADITGQQVTAGNLTVTAGNGAADFTANTTTLLNVNTVTVNGTTGTGGDASITVQNAQIDTSNDNVLISTAGTNGGTKGIYAKSLKTGDDQVLQANNGIVTMTGTGNNDSSAKLELTDSLQTRELNLTGIANNANAVVTNINNVDVTFIDTTFNFTNTVGSSDQGASGVYFKTISLGATDGTAVRTLTSNAGLGTYWADTLKVNVHNDPAQSQNWVGNIWLGGHPGNPTTATGTVGTVDMILPANANLTSYLGNGSGPNYMLKVDGQVTLADGATVNLRATQGNPFAGLKLNDQIQLVDSTQQVIDNTTQGVPVNGYSVLGAKDYFFNLQVAENGQDLLANYVWSNPSVAKAYLEGNIAALGNLYQGSELESRVVRNTFDPYVQGGLFKEGSKLGMMFGAEYANMRLDSGSHVDADYYNMVIGPAMRAETGIGRLGVAIFFETGHGDYSSYNSFPGLNVDGDGNTDYYGGGIALRNDFADGIYADLSMRAGTVSTDQNLKNRFRAHYDDDTTYVGGHVGLGKIFDFSDRGRLDIYGGMLWTRLSGYSTTTDAAEHLDFDDANSLRSQLGGRYHYTFCKMATGYVGAAWEYEFDGDVGGTLDGVAIDEPSLQGSTGKGELGVSISPAKNLSIDLGVQGYTGEREGVGATAALTLTF